MKTTRASFLLLFLFACGESTSPSELLPSPDGSVDQHSPQQDASSFPDAPGETEKDSAPPIVDATPDSGDPTEPLQPTPDCKVPPVTANCTNGWCKIPAGCFIMGTPPGEIKNDRISERQVQVTLTHDFEVQQFEMTEAEWSSFGLALPVKFGKHEPPEWGQCVDGPQCPVGGMTWEADLAFANLYSKSKGLPECYTLSGCTGTLDNDFVCEKAEQTTPSVYECRGYRLMTEAEWEYAARAGTATAFYSGPMKVNPDNKQGCWDEPSLDAIAWYCFNSGDPNQTHRVGQKQPNGWGLHDMLGNAAEYLSNYYTSEGYGPSPQTDPFSKLNSGYPPRDITRIFRGGHFAVWSSILRSGNRLYTTKGAVGAAAGLGFRLARTLFPSNADAGVAPSKATN